MNKSKYLRLDRAVAMHHGSYSCRFRLNRRCHHCFVMSSDRAARQGEKRVRSQVTRLIRCCLFVGWIRPEQERDKNEKHFCGEEKEDDHDQHANKTPTVLLPAFVKMMSGLLSLFTSTTEIPYGLLPVE
jgi:hypothetical protein